MSDGKSRETQADFFGTPSAEPKKEDRFSQLARAQKPILFSTNTEQLLMAGILFILALCGVFFLGVIRGKSLPQAVEKPPAPVGGSPPVSAPPSRPVAASVFTPPPPVEAARRVPEASLKPYTIQIVTHRKKELATAEMNSLRTQGLYSFIIPSGEYFQVCAGQYASKEEAKKDLDRFKAKHKDAFLRRR